MRRSTDCARTSIEPRAPLGLFRRVASLGAVRRDAGAVARSPPLAPTHRHVSLRAPRDAPLAALARATRGRRGQRGASLRAADLGKWTVSAFATLSRVESRWRQAASAAATPAAVALCHLEASLTCAASDATGTARPRPRRAVRTSGDAAWAQGPPQSSRQAPPGSSTLRPLTRASRTTEAATRWAETRLKEASTESEAARQRTGAIARGREPQRARPNSAALLRDADDLSALGVGRAAFHMDSAGGLSRRPTRLGSKPGSRSAAQARAARRRFATPPHHRRSTGSGRRASALQRLLDRWDDLRSVALTRRSASPSGDPRASGASASRADGRCHGSRQRRSRCFGPSGRAPRPEGGSEWSAGADGTPARQRHRRQGPSRARDLSRLGLFHGGDARLAVSHPRARHGSALLWAPERRQGEAGQTPCSMRTRSSRGAGRDPWIEQLRLRRLPPARRRRRHEERRPPTDAQLLPAYVPAVARYAELLSGPLGETRRRRPPRRSSFTRLTSDPSRAHDAWLSASSLWTSRRTRHEPPALAAGVEVGGKRGVHGAQDLLRRNEQAGKLAKLLRHRPVESDSEAADELGRLRGSLPSHGRARALRLPRGNTRKNGATTRRSRPHFLRRTEWGAEAL